MTTIIFGILEEGLIYTIMALGVYTTYKTLDFPDLSVNGTFPLDATLTTISIADGFLHPFATLILLFAAGAAAGCITGLIHVELEVRNPLSRIIAMTTLCSINLRIAGKSNPPIFNKNTIFSSSFLSEHVPAAMSLYAMTIILLVIILVCKLLLDAHLRTRSGYLLRAVGGNDVLVTSLAKDRGMVKIMGLAIANNFVVLAGSVYCQQKGLFDISIDIGTIAVGLTDIIVGTQLFERFGFVRSTTAIIIGSVIYKARVSLTLLPNDIKIGSLTISVPVTTSDLKLITSVLFLIILVLSTSRERKVKSHAWVETYQ